MNSLVLLIGGIILFLLAYILYGRYLTKKWGLDKDVPTPAHNLNDNIDYVPTDARVLFGHHFSSIAGAGPITGPVGAALFGWVPVYLWIVIGSIFFGGVHDYGSLAASIDNEGRSIGEIIKTSISTRAKTLFNVYAWVTITLVVAAFTDICAKSFAYSAESGVLTGAQAGTASMIFIVLALAFGIVRNRFNASLAISTIVGVALIIAAIAFGYMCPVIKLGVNGWRIVLIIYIAFASVLPVWLLLQPRDYLCSFLLYAMMAGALVGVFIKHPTMNLVPFAGMNVGGNPMFPILFVTVACGAISGFHSLISSGTSSKQLNYTRDAQAVGYGSMLVEGLLAIITLIVVGVLSYDGIHNIDGDKLGTAAQVFGSGVAQLMNSFGVPVKMGTVFVTLAFSAFALTSLDTATRIGRFLMQELSENLPEANPLRKVGGNMYIATIATIAVSVIFLVAGYAKVWPIFGAANQLLAAFALMAITAWVLKKGKHSLETIIPMVLMFAITLTALFILIKKNLSAGGFVPLAIVGIVLFILAILQILEAISIFKKATK